MVVGGFANPIIFIYFISFRFIIIIIFFSSKPNIVLKLINYFYILLQTHLTYFNSLI